MVQATSMHCIAAGASCALFEGEIVLAVASAHVRSLHLEAHTASGDSTVSNIAAATNEKWLLHMMVPTPPDIQRC